MEKLTLEFVSIDTWTLIFTWCNLGILFLLMKKFLFKPIANIIKQREDEIGKLYEDAETAEAKAKEMETEYTAKLANAKGEAEEIVQTAVRNAQARADQLLHDTEAQAASMIESANKRIEREQKAAVAEAKADICSMAVMIASKVIEKDMDDRDQSRLVAQCIDEMGDQL